MRTAPRVTVLRVLQSSICLRPPFLCDSHTSENKMPCDEKMEIAAMEAMKKIFTGGTLPKESESVSKLIEYTKSQQPDGMMAMDPKWEKKKGGGGCVLL